MRISKQEFGIDDNCTNVVQFTQVITIIDSTNPAADQAAQSEDVTLECSDATGIADAEAFEPCLLYTSPSPRDKRQSRMPSSA